MEALITKVNAFLTKLYPSCLEGLVPLDKFMHILGGFVIGAILTPFIGGTSVIVVMLIALAKEVYDSLNKAIHTPDFWDWLVTVGGGVIGFVIISLI